LYFDIIKLKAKLEIKRQYFEELKQKLGEIGGKNEQMAKTYQGYS